MLKVPFLAIGILVVHCSAHAALEPLLVRDLDEKTPTIIIKDEGQTDRIALEFAINMGGSYISPEYYHDLSQDRDIEIACDKNGRNVQVCFFMMKPSAEVIYDKTTQELTVESSSKNTGTIRNLNSRKKFPINLQYENSCGDTFQLYIDETVFRLKAKKLRPGC